MIAISASLESKIFMKNRNIFPPSSYSFFFLAEIVISMQVSETGMKNECFRKDESECAILNK